VETLEHAYESALAVLTAPVSFLEWTTLKVENSFTPDPRVSDDWSPVGLSFRYGGEGYEWDPAQAIEGERYIYVFARRVWGSDVPTLVEELHLDADGTITATQLGTRLFPDPRPLDGKDSPLPEKRQRSRIGTTMRFVRRVRTSRLAHYFFASRIPLSRRAVEELRHNVVGWVPETQFDALDYVPKSTSEPDVPSPTTFGEWDPNVLTGLGPGALQVPVLDPITIALHLHDLATSATGDLLDYVTTYDDQRAEARERVVKRQQKLVLAYLVQMVLKNYDTALYGAQHSVSVKTDTFVQKYWEQVNYRLRERERWWTYLGNWLQADPIEFLSRAHFEQPAQHWQAFLLPMLLCFLDASGSQAGRDLVAAVVKDKKRWRWFHRQILPGLDEGPEEDTKAETYQVPRKFALAVLEVVKEMGPGFLDHSTAAMWRVLGAHSKNFSLRFMVDGGPLDKDPLVAAKKFEESQEKLHIQVPEPEEIVEEWHELAEHHYKGKVLKITAVVELLDLALSVRQFINERSGEHAVTLVRSMADTSALLLEFAHGAKGKLLSTLFRMRPGLVVLGGVLEGYLAVQDARKAAAKDDSAGVASGVITAGGAAVSTLGFVATVALEAVGLELSFTPFFVVGLILMGIGAIVGLFKDTPMETFLKFCAFGKNGGGGELVEGLEEMKEGEYGQQLEVLLNLLCRVKIERADMASIDGGARTDDARAARFTMGWIPDGAYLTVDYRDQWHLGPEQFEGQGLWNYEEGGGDQSSKRIDFGKGGMALSAERQFDLMLSKARFFRANSYDYAFEAHFVTQLHVAFGNFTFVVPPEPVDFEIDLQMPASR
jgi:hypothetical protein